MKSLSRICFVFVAITLGILQFACGNSDKKATETNELNTTDTAKVYISPDLSAMSDLNQNDTLSIKIDGSEKMYQLVVRRVQENIPGIRSISANVGDQETGLATLIYRDGRLSGFIDIYETNVRWQIEYDTDKDAYYLNEIKPEDRDELEGGIPLTPPNEEY